jgi:succinyl-diaminopimelate desuccinylase
MAHGAMPYAGVNPIVGLMRFLAASRRSRPTEQARLGPHEHLGLPWITPTIVRAPVRGEAQLNVMPDEAYAALDVRTVPGQDHEAIHHALQGAARRRRARHAAAAIELDWFESRPWTETPADDPLVRALEPCTRSSSTRRRGTAACPERPTAPSCARPPACRS